MAVAPKTTNPREAYGVILANTNDTQLCKTTWHNSKNGTFRIRKINITNNHATDAALIILWDQDLSDATPGSYGSNAAPIWVRKVNAVSSVEIGEDLLPCHQFIAGISVKTDKATTYVNVEVEQEIL